MEGCTSSLLNEIKRLQELTEKVVQPLSILPALYYDEGKKELDEVCNSTEKLKENVETMKENLQEYKGLIDELKVSYYYSFVFLHFMCYYNICTE